MLHLRTYTQPYGELRLNVVSREGLRALLSVRRHLAH
jgi:hypothetical protein